jgi:N-acetylglucosamine-6-sulfatase
MPDFNTQTPRQERNRPNRWRTLLMFAVLATLYGCGQVSSPPEQPEKQGDVVRAKTATPEGAGQQETTQGMTQQAVGNTQTAPAKPNYVFILVDDMRKDDLKYMPKTRALLAQGGMSFNNAYVSNALCCPSRATIMRGQYSHNSGVWTTHNSSIGGSWEAYKSKGYEQDNVATRLHDAGYRTALIGKYLNHYPGTSVPLGWNHWFATFSQKYFDYDVNDNGTIRHFGMRDSDYLTDVLRRETVAFIGNSAADGVPFFAYVAPNAPHNPAIPAPRDAHTYDGEKAPRLPSFNEADVSDKPSWIQSLPRLSTDQIAKSDFLHKWRVESLQAVDDLVEGVVNKLNNAGVMRNTYIFFTSDNGWHHGEHRIPAGKWRPYEESNHIPLLVRGPGVAAGSTTTKLALNTDYFPTFTTLAGIPTPSYVDGRSLRPVIKGNSTAWRSAILLEAAERRSYDERPSPAYYGIRTSDGRKYLEYDSGHRELYNLGADPYERFNNYNTAAPPSDLATRLQALKVCAGDTCHQAEGGQK